MQVIRLTRARGVPDLDWYKENDDLWLASQKRSLENEVRHDAL